jgi:hypothetical protein
LTRGGAGWGGLTVGRRRDELPEIRAAEPKGAAHHLGLASVEICDYPDGAVQACDQDEVTGVRQIAYHERQLQPWLLNTLAAPPILRLFGAEGHSRVGAESVERSMTGGLFPELEA